MHEPKQLNNKEALPAFHSSRSRGTRKVDMQEQEFCVSVIAKANFALTFLVGVRDKCCSEQEDRPLSQLERAFI